MAFVLGPEATPSAVAPAPSVGHRLAGPFTLRNRCRHEGGLEALSPGALAQGFPGCPVAPFRARRGESPGSARWPADFRTGHRRRSWSSSNGDRPGTATSSCHRPVLMCARASRTIKQRARPEQRSPQLAAPPADRPLGPGHPSVRSPQRLIRLEPDRTRACHDRSRKVDPLTAAKNDLGSQREAS